MKTSVIEVHAMLSVLSVDEVEKRIGEVPGVESVTVNYAAGSATVRYDETRLEVADIKSAVRQREYDSAAPAVASTDAGHEGHMAPGEPVGTGCRFRQAHRTFRSRTTSRGAAYTGCFRRHSGTRTGRFSSRRTQRP
jgi:copper chaperone CopZ